jgi:hypothetical protein
MAYAVVAYRDGKSPLAKFVTTDKDEADAMVEEHNGGARGTTYYQVEDYDPAKHTGQPKMTPDAEAEIGPLTLAEGGSKRAAMGYTHPGAEKGEAPEDADDNKK